MNMLKFGYGIVLDGFLDIPESHFFLGPGRPQTRFSSNVVFIFQKCLNVWKDIICHVWKDMSGSQACRDSPHGLIEKEMCHLKAEKNKLNHSGCLLSQILFHCFVCLCYMYLPHFVLIMYVPIKIIVRSFGSSKNTKLEDGPYCTISGNEPS